MTTTNVKTIKTEGGDYTSLQNWEADRQADITAATGSDSIEEAVCYAMEDTYVIIQGWTVAAANYIYIHTDSTARHAGVWDESKYHMVQNESGTMYIREDYVRIDGLQMCINLSGTADQACISGERGDTGNGDVRISNSIFRAVIGSATCTATGIGYYWVDLPNVKFWNNIVYDTYNSGNSSGYGLAISGGSLYCYNNTIYNCWIGIQSENTGNQYYKNNIVQNCVHACYHSAFTTANCSNNCSDDNTQPGTSGQNGKVAFVDEAGDNFHLSTFDAFAHNKGVNLYNDANIPFQTDIDGRNRGGAGSIWDIGADELFFGLQSEEFTTTGNFAVPANCTLVWVTLVGGGGGGTPGWIYTGDYGGPGGGGGEYASKIPVSVSSGKISVTIGTGGAGGIGGGNNGGADGGNGGSSNFGSYVVVAGGKGPKNYSIAKGAWGIGGGVQGGTTVGAKGNSYITGAGGAAGGDEYFAGAEGGNCVNYAGGQMGAGKNGGAGGGASGLGPGGKGGDNNSGTPEAGATPAKYGGGGGGGGISANNFANGGNGANGYCLVEWMEGR